jgi:hypothetical protein
MIRPNPFTLTGASDWRDYSIDVDIHVPRYGVATLLGRIDNADVFQDSNSQNPSAYVLTIHADGKWQLASTSFKHQERNVASGTLPPLADAWHHVSFAFHEDKLTGTFDVQELFSLRDAEHAAGQAGIGSNWTRVAFDNLRFTQTGITEP